jgi:outer membrane protein assembly factor BamB
VAAVALLTASCTQSSVGPGSGASSGASVSSAPVDTAPTDSAATSPPSAGPAGTADWPTYHRTNDRAGAVADLPAVHRLSPAWTSRLDAEVYGQPLVVGDLVLAATENNTVYGIVRATGRIRWRRHLGTPVRRRDLPCGNIDPLGITGTPAYDESTGSVFVVTETTGAHHTLVALDAVTGTERWRRALDVTSHDRRAEQQRGALAVANGRVYAPFGGLYGDCGDYVGYVTATPVGGAGATTWYAVPTRREGGIWAPSGVAVGSAGDVWVAVGNGASTHGRYDGSDSVLRLSSDLSRRLDFFAPATWAAQNATDTDLGSTGPLLLGTDRVLVSGKGAEVFLLDSAHLGGIGGELARLTGCAGYGGGAWDAAAHAAFVPCADGVLRIGVGSRSLRRGWKAPRTVTGSPVVGRGAVWALDPVAGRLHVLDERTGHEIAAARTGTATRFASPVLSGRLVLVPTLSGVSALTIS